jgi:hypothetical protein
MEMGRGQLPMGRSGGGEGGAEQGGRGGGGEESRARGRAGRQERECRFLMHPLPQDVDPAQARLGVGATSSPPPPKLERPWRGRRERGRA